MYQKQGFTLIELLIVVLIIGILSAVALPQYQRVVAKARLTEVIVQAKAIRESIILYKLANGNDNHFDLQDLDVWTSSDNLKIGSRRWYGNCLTSTYFYTSLRFPGVSANIGCHFQCSESVGFCYAPENSASVFKSMGWEEGKNSLGSYYIVPSWSSK